jgi:hypothetical protein
LWILIGVATLAAGGVTSTVTAPPSPLVGVGFGVSALILVVSFLLAARVTIALERARRLSRPVVAPDVESYPVFRRLFRVGTPASGKKE